MTHSHTWTRSARKHKHPGRIFVECACGQQRQASTITGALVVFDTGREQGGETVLLSFRLDKVRAKKLRKHKVNIRAVMEKHIDEL